MSLEKYFKQYYTYLPFFKIREHSLLFLITFKAKKQGVIGNFLPAQKVTQDHKFKTFLQVGR